MYLGGGGRGGSAQPPSIGRPGGGVSAPGVSLHPGGLPMLMTAGFILNKSEHVRWGWGVVPVQGVQGCGSL